eukprot:3560677-Pleurochrysis_carterae.AAC.1
MACIWSEGATGEALLPRRKRCKVRVWLRGAQAVRRPLCLAGREDGRPRRRHRVAGDACTRQHAVPAWRG